MPIVPDMVLWQTLLGACKTYRNVEMAETVTRKLVEMGSKSDGNFVLLSNIYASHDEEKENALYQHSEKLAVAYGLVCANDEDGTPIQVIKNLRICGDCHVVMKLVSKMYNREIIVRDRVRFHRFKDGICSCRDYW
ncbi:Pentatricopeptide repeat-containing protein At1g34160 [Linum perenne]